ncbi:hypothetical protein LTR37_006930 [Vermiconidia calcicola]|uniref:Uncharacterized protein n=1 Tax=Vermiconidia calcicola TaxID=1690605 RepID=A0ACC3NET2_9PEZI|nr:hypothetical protein LTR37_006930 [Vermiconidia calcicola]
MEDATIDQFFSNLSLYLPPQNLQFEGGNVIIKLSDRVEDQLLLHESVLSAASERFRLRFSNHAFAGPREATSPRTGKSVKVYEYQLTSTDDTFCLTDEGEAESKDQPDDTHFWHAFQGSALVEGFLRRNYGPEIGLSGYTYQDLRAQVVFEHKLLFATLYDQPFDTDFPHSSNAVYTLTEIAALAHYYLLLPSVAGRLASRFEAVPGIWEDVARNSTFYLALSTKLRSANIFEDALRHYVGMSLESKAMWKVHPSDDPDVARIAFGAQLRLQDRMHTLTKELRELGLSWYQSKPWETTKRRRGPKVRTTWLASGREKKTLADKCRWLAASIYREFLDQKIYGESHWSHLKYGNTDPPNGQVDAGSLRIACQAILDANKSPEKLELFNKMVAAR